MVPVALRSLIYCLMQKLLVIYKQSLSGQVLMPKNVATKFGFVNASTDADEILKKDDINTLFIATQHDTHAKYVIDGLKHN